MTLAIYPLAVRGLTWPLMKTYEFSTTVPAAPNFYTTRVINSQNPIWHFTLIYEYLKDNPLDIVSALSPYTDYRFLQGFLLSNQGQFTQFLLDDLTDDSFLNPMPGGTAANPSIFKVSIYPTQEFYYPLGSYVVDNNATPHLQLVVQAGVSGATVPAFSITGGTVTSGSAKFQDQGIFNGANAQVLPLVSDSTDPVSAASVGSSAGTAFQVGDQLAVTGGGGTGAVLQVASIGSGGFIVSFTIVSGGSGYTTTSNASLAVLTGSGTGSPTANITATTLYYTPLQRNFGGQFLEDVTDLNTTVYPLKVWANGVLQAGSGVNYTLAGPGLAIPGFSYQGLYLAWTAQPTGPITASAQFYFRMCLESDQQDIEEFMQQLWTIGGTSGKNGSGMLKLVTSRAARV